MTGIQAPPAPERTVTTVASHGVAYLVHWLVILLLLSQAVISVLRPPDGVLAVGVVTGLICLVWATFCLGMGILRGHDADGADLPPPPWLGVITTAGCLVSFEVIRASFDLVGSWPAELMVAGLFVATVTVWTGPVGGGVTGIVVASIALLTAVGGDAQDPLLRTSLANAVPAISLVAAGFSVALALGALVRAAGRLEGNLDARDAVLVQERAVQAASQVAAEVERSLHDTALNTLETISAHGDHLPRADVAARCRSDHEQLSAWRREADLTDIDGVVAHLEAHARRVSLSLEVALVRASEDPADVLAPIPGPVLAALAGAGTEALTNVAKHSGGRTATLLVRTDEDGVQVFVADAGVGLARADEGFGITHSIRERMLSVGGQALTGQGPGGQGTVVLLEWHQRRPAVPEIGSDLLVGTAQVVLMVAVFLSSTAVALTVLGWSAYTHPWLALGAAVAPVLVAASAVERARSGYVVGAPEAVATCATYVLVGAVALLADPFCATLLGEGVMLDARVPMMAVLLLLAPRTGVLAAIVATVGLTNVAVALAWGDRLAVCGPGTAEYGIYILAILGAAWLFVRRIALLSTELADARAQAVGAQVRLRAELSVRAEEELWVADTLGSAQQLLDDIAEGRCDPGAPGTRAACAAEAGFLRALLAVGRAPMPLRRPARIWLRLLRAHHCRVLVRGSFERIEPPAETIGEVGGVIDALCALAPGASVTLSAWADPTPSVLLAAEGPALIRAEPHLVSRFDRFAVGAAREVGPDGVTLEWAWEPDRMPSAASSG
ncbi:MAG: hypothetical protein OEV20_01750 [Actinomycetota bacterium]|nr:hypothetical protein [Actinomycetota bacterium]